MFLILWVFEIPGFIMLTLCGIPLHPGKDLKAAQSAMAAWLKITVLGSATVVQDQTRC